VRRLSEEFNLLSQHIFLASTSAFQIERSSRALEASGKKHCGVFCGNLNIDQPPVASFVGRVNGPQEQVADP
jgi:hypothetical protein